MLSRRGLMGAMLALPLGAGGALPATAGAPLRLKPPGLRKPRHLKVTPDLTAGGKRIILDEPDQDWVLELPQNAYLPHALFIQGMDTARHIVIVGGGIMPDPISDRTSMRLLDGSDWAVYALRGFTGADGGTFRLSNCENSYLPGIKPRWTDPIPWNANADMIADALERIVGTEALFAVEGGKAPGGPWKIVPKPGSALLGRPRLDITNLKGSAIKRIEKNHFMFAVTCGVTFRHWRGTAHMEGVSITGEHLIDGINVQNPWGDSVLQLANVHSAPSSHEFHDDWIHGDGAQFYLGPSIARFENVDLISLGGNGFIAQPMDVKLPRPLDRLGTWSFRNCHFRAIADDRHPGANASGGNACFRASYAELDNHWVMDNVYCSRTRRSDGVLLTSDSTDRYYFYRGQDSASPIFDRLPDPLYFADPTKGQCGPAYASPGYR